MAEEQKILSSAEKILISKQGSETIKTDIIAASVIGEIVALIMLGISVVSKDVEEIKFVNDISYLWLLILVLPALSILGILFARLLAKKIPVIIQVAKFFLIGILNTFIGLGVLSALMWFFSIFAGWQYSVFVAISFTFAVFNSYFWNKFWTFKKKETQVGAKEFSEFYLITGIGFLINISIASLLVNIIGPQFGFTIEFWAYIGSIIATICVATWNFLGYKFIVFKK